MTAGIGSTFGSVGSFGNELLRAGAHGLSNGVISGMTGGDFLQSFATGALGSLAGSAFQAYAPKVLSETDWGIYGFSGVTGGLTSVATGGNFWEGAATAIMITALNHEGEKLRDANYKRMIEKADDWEEKFRIWLRWKRVDEYDKKFIKAIEKGIKKVVNNSVAQGAALFYVPADYYNNFTILTTGHDMYNNPAGTLDYVAAGAGIVTGGVASGVFRVSKGVVNVANKIYKATTYYSIFNLLNK